MSDVIRFPHERSISAAGEYYCSGHPDCKGPSLPIDHNTFCDLGERCDVHWIECEFCVPVETLAIISRNERRKS